MAGGGAAGLLAARAPLVMEIQGVKTGGAQRKRYKTRERMAASVIAAPSQRRTPMLC